jgi:hypothetical protein
LPFPPGLPGLALRCAWLLALLISALRALVLRLRAASSLDRGFAAFLVCANVAALLACEYFGLRGAQPALFLWAFAYVAAYVAHSQTLRVDESLSILPGAVAGDSPARAILRHNNAMLAAFIALAGLLALMAARLPIGRLARLLGAAALAALRWLVSAIAAVARLFSRGEPPAPAQGSLPPAMEAAPLPAMEAAETPLWAQVLGAVVFWLVLAALAAGAVYAVAYGCYQLYRRFYASGYSDGGGDVREDIGPARAAGRARMALGSLGRRLLPQTEAEKVRRAYFRKVRRHIRRGAGVLRSDTTGEIAEKILPQEDIGELTERYDRARYGRQD